MSRVFDAYARYYDLLYRDKDYAGEAGYVASHIHNHRRVPESKRILELGCGTGAHAEHLARMGYTVHGVDRSETMHVVIALFFFDFWYGPAILTQESEMHVRHLEDDGIRVTRTAEPVMRANLNVVDVNHAVRIELKASGKVEQLQETHSMRYLFLFEVSRLFEPGTWSAVKTFVWLGHEEPAQSDWSACAMAICR